ncbi:MAG: hypothetical protein JXR84_27185 [Anaerolineae bacterium]|nr:hypothetical protein [Anaerolineae bacterium]
MKRYLAVVALVFVFLLSIAAASPALAAPPDPDEIVLALPMPDFDKFDIPVGLTPETAERYAQQLTYQAASPLLLELEQLQTEGLVAGYTVRPDLHAVVVTGMMPKASARLSRAQELNDIYPSVDEMPACAANVPQALATRVLAESVVLQNTRPAALQATDPSITVYFSPSSNYGGISGMTAPSTAVTVRVLRKGIEVIRRTTTSSSQGYYSVYSNWQSCPVEGYDFGLYPGDVVEVTANGNMVNTVVANLSGWVNPDTNVVAGTTDVGRTVDVQLYDYPGCTSNHYQRSPGVDASGNFTADFTSLVDFDRRAYAYIYALDSNGNSTYTYFYAFRLYGYFDEYGMAGYLKPNVNVQATLGRGETVLATVDTQTNAGGYFWAYFSQMIQAGDIVTATGGGATIVYVATHVTNLDFDATADQIAGVTTAGRQVRANFYKRYGTGYYVATACAYTYDCAVATADGTGAFTVDLMNVDFARGDYGYLYVYDAQGNYQYDYGYNFPAIVADLSYRYVRGYWRQPYATLTVILRDSGGIIKSTTTGVWVDSDGAFSTYMSSIAPGDTLEVGNGVATETMTIQNTTAILGSGGLSGSAYNGALVAYLYDLNYPYGTTYCNAFQVAGGLYSLPFTDAQIGPWDYAYVWNAGPDGHYTMQRPRTFSIEAEKGDRYVWGYTAQPATPMTITLLRGGSPVATATTTSGSYGYYGVGLYATQTVTISQGDTVRVVAGSDNTADVPIPALDAHADGVNNRVYGVAPANESVNVSVRRTYRGWWSWSRSTGVDADGNYSVSFDGLYWSRDCSLVDAGHPCIQPAVTYYTPAEHRIWYGGPYPDSVGPDAYEVDDAYMQATPYMGVQSHSFHAVTDTDWISFTVPAADIANQVHYQVKTFNLGWGMATQVRIYHANTLWMPLVDVTGYENEDTGIGVDISWWMPPETGVYYVEILPPSSSYAAYCDAIYDVMIFPQRARVFLPLVLRSH